MAFSPRDVMVTILAIGGIVACTGSEVPDDGGAAQGGALTTSGGALSENSGVGGAIADRSSSRGGTPSSVGGRAAGSSVVQAGSPGTGGSMDAKGGALATGGAVTGGARSSSTATMTFGGSSAMAGSTGSAGSVSAGCQESTCGSHKWPCWKIPTPPSLKLPNPQSYTDLGNGAVRDNVTCLVWEKANPSTAGTLQASIDRCAALAKNQYAGFSDWRMPTRMEMASITDVTLGSKGFPTVFTTTSGYYMTGSDWYKTILTDNDSTASNETNMVWGYGTNGFTSNAIVRTGTNLVARCVRGNGKGEAQGQYAVEPPNHYVVTGTGADAVVKDNYTGLVWQQAYSTTRMPWSDAAAYCDAQTTGGFTDWRVPTLTELASTVNEALVAPAINRTVFPNTNKSCDPDGWYWAMEASKVGGTAWGLSYCDGYTGWNAATDASKWNYFVDGWVRCVR